ncbi:MAG TPA: LptA/OstA family protein [Candidatus Dormibacteraeota bacterium]|nr:LptA/OstA family protein [Candidatus Dormibacteraeota bacterium]
MIRLTFTFVAAIALMTPFAGAAPPPPPRQQVPPRQQAPARSPSAAPSPGASSGTSAASFDLGVWTVHASSLDANFKNGDFSTPAKVVMTRVGGDVTADRANGNYKKQVLYLNGHVVVHDTQGSAETLGGGAPPHAASPSTLTADKAQIDGTAKVYKAIGNVRYVQADTVVNADNGTLDDEAHTLLLEGMVHIAQGNRNMNARKVLYNTVTGTAHAEGDVTMQFPGEMHRKLATPRPLKVPKNGLTQPVSSAAP